jgi:hypothetical protein
VANLDHKYDQYLVFDLTKNAIIPHPITPVFTQLSPKSLSMLARIIRPFDPVIQKGQDPSACIRPKLPEFP